MRRQAQKWLGVGMLSLALLLAGSMPAFTQSPALVPFYKGKTVRFINWTTPGSGGDLDARLVARHLVKHIPGNPSIIVENRPGGGGLISYNYLATVAKPDGLTFGMGGASFGTLGISKLPEVKFDLLKMEYVACLRYACTVLEVRRDFPCKNLKELKTCIRPLRVGMGAPGQLRGVAPELLKEALGLNMNIIYGYPGDSQMALAFEGGEIDAMTGSWDNFMSMGRLEKLKKGELFIMAQSGVKRISELPDSIPYVLDVVPEEWKPVYRIVNNLFAQSRPIFFAPGTPKERVKIFIQAFRDLHKDPAFLGEAKNKGLLVAPTYGEEVLGRYKAVLSEPKEKIDRIVKVLTAG